MRVDRTVTQRAAAAALCHCLLAACMGSAPAATRWQPEPRSPSSGYLTIAGNDLLRAGPEKSLLAAIQLLRPTWLSARMTAPAVSVDGSPPTDPAVLASIPVRVVSEVRLIRASHAAARTRVREDGAVISGDLIVVATRSQ